MFNVLFIQGVLVYIHSQLGGGLVGVHSFSTIVIKG